MKYYYFFSLFSVLAYTNAVCQNSVLVYKVSKSVTYTNSDGFQKEAAKLEYDGFIFQKGNTAIYYEKPLYLSLYPTGEIVVQNENETHGYGICIDTMQSICYRNYDSLVFRTRFMMSGGMPGENLVSNFESGSQKWQILSDTTTIDGLHCQKAERNNKAGQLAWIVWFCPQIETLSGPDGITDLPGIVVEAENLLSNKKLSLVSYKQAVQNFDYPIWPNVFNEPFKGEEKLRFMNDKLQKLSEISNQ